MKYKVEYLETLDKDKFIKLLNKRYKVKKDTARRRWYDVKKFVRIPKHDETSKVRPGIFKMLQFDDMVKYRSIINRENLRKYGFKEYEINWLEDNGYLDGHNKK